MFLDHAATVGIVRSDLVLQALIHSFIAADVDFFSCEERSHAKVDIVFVSEDRDSVVGALVHLLRSQDAVPGRVVYGSWCRRVVVHALLPQLLERKRVLLS